MKRWLSRMILTLSALWLLAWAINALTQEDQPLIISEQTIEQLRVLRTQDKFTDLPGYDTKEEKERLQNHLNHLLDRLISGVMQHPLKSWVVSEMEPAISEVYLEDTEARERFVDYINQTFAILGVTVNGNEFAQYLFFLK